MMTDSILSMPVCEHIIPMGEICSLCGRFPIEDSPIIFSPTEKRIEDLAKKIEVLEGHFANIHHIVSAAQTAEELFAKKVHELKYIDKKRDDVIAVLCQKTEVVSQRLATLEEICNHANTRR